MFDETDARTRLLAYYDGKAQELEAAAERVRDNLEHITDQVERQKTQGRITRLLGLAKDSRDKARRVRATASSGGSA